MIKKTIRRRLVREMPPYCVCYCLRGVGIVNALLLVHKIIVGETTFLEHGGEALYVLLGDTMANVDAYLVVLPVGNVLQQVLDIIRFLSP